MNGRRVLLTGATGAAGRFIAPALLDAGYAVRGQFSRKPGDDARIEWVQHDFLKSLDMGPLVAGADAVIHLAASLSDIPVMDRVNVEATAALLGAAQTAGVRYFGHASSVVVYGSPRRPEVNEKTPLIDPSRPIAPQYYAETYMREYARTKTLAELAIRKAQPAISVDLYRPTVVADLDRLLESRDWSLPRKVLSLYRRTQYIYASDAAAALIHLMRRGFAEPARGVEAFNIADADGGTFHSLHAHAYAKARDPRFRAPIQIPVVLDVAKDLLRNRTLAVRCGLGALRISNAALLATDFAFPTGIGRAYDLALAQVTPERPA